MSRFPVTTPRGNRQPPLALRTHILAIGDVHFTEGAPERTDRANIAARDINKMIGNTVLSAAIQLGDQTTIASSTEFSWYATWKGTLVLPSGCEWGEVPGNHDLMGNNASGGTDIRTPLVWAESMRGLEAPKDIVIDLPGVRLLLLSPAQDASTGEAHHRRLTLDPATLDWCDDRISETDSKCILFFHAPLPDTVGPLDGSAFSSYDERWNAHHDTAYDIADMVAGHDNIIAWVAGHTHSRVTEVDLVKTVTFGTVKIACISVGGPAFLNPGAGYATDGMYSALITVTDAGVDVRYRSHGAGQWLEPVYEVDLT